MTNACPARGAADLRTRRPHGRGERRRGKRPRGSRSAGPYQPRLTDHICRLGGPEIAPVERSRMVHEEEELASAQHGAAFPHRHRATHPIGHSALGDPPAVDERSEEHTSELQSLMRSSYAVVCLKKKKTINKNT